ncbi:hypothetical protein LWI28_010899 [Acer negundo]|uniref:Disease resistance protein At4g27190-like leucine-rich repeats domain-containing protein n=1 Tax=Acer negundo TaxID=4023 RepID=A0AAD5IM18_ACENE|nr:hypothetical protein LWI28_010899 [Acer negundo]
MVHLLSGISSRMFLAEGFAQGFSKVEKLDIVAYDEPTSFLKSGNYSLLEFKTSMKLYFKIGFRLSSSDEEMLQQQELPGRCQYLILEDCQDPVKLEQALQSLSFLRGISIKCSKEIKFFPETGLPSQLRFIDIDKCDALQSLPMAWMHSSNTNLEELSVRFCDSLTCIDRVQLPTNLKQLVIGYCSNLLSVLDEEEVSGSCNNTSCLEHLIIYSCPSLTSLWSKSNELPNSLRYLSIRKCSKLESIAECFHDNTKLEELYIVDCMEVLFKVDVEVIYWIVRVPSQREGTTEYALKNCALCVHINDGCEIGVPSGRYSDGRLIIDFIADKLGLPYLNAYLDALLPNFRHGAGFAAAGATIQPVDAKIFGAGFNPLSLDIQLLHKSKQIKSTLPRPEDFSKALYTLDCGQNDLHFGLTSMSEEQTKASIPNIINHFATAVENLYQGGARMFWIHNTGPIGCLPFFVINYPPQPGNADQTGCIKSYNEVAQEFNKQLKDRVSQLRTQFHEAVLIYVDIYSAKYTLISEAKKHGFIDPLGYCCKHPGNNQARCWNTIIVNGTEVNAVSCEDPSKYINWDGFVNPLGYCCKHPGNNQARCWNTIIVNGTEVNAVSFEDASKYINWGGIHYTEAANRWIANHIADGSFSDPPIPLTKACQKPVFSR